MKNNPLPLVSIVLPIRNDSPIFIESCFSSIKNQSYKNIEVIVIDDSDSEETINSIDKLKGDNFQIVREPNRKKGLPSALNRGIELASGDYIARMDADDIQHEKRIENQVTFFLSHPETDIIGCNTFIIDDKNNNLGIKIFAEKNRTIIRKMSISNPLSHPTLMFRKRFFEIAGNYNTALKRAEDYDLWFRARKSKKIRFHNIQENLVYYRVSNIEKRDKLNWIINLQLKLKYFKASYFISSLMGIIMVILFIIIPDSIKKKIYNKYTTC